MPSLYVLPIKKKKKSAGCCSSTFNPVHGFCWPRQEVSNNASTTCTTPRIGRRYPKLKRQKGHLYRREGWRVQSHNSLEFLRRSSVRYFFHSFVRFVLFLFLFFYVHGVAGLSCCLYGIIAGAVRRASVAEGGRVQGAGGLRQGPRDRPTPVELHRRGTGEAWFSTNFWLIFDYFLTDFGLVLSRWACS